MSSTIFTIAEGSKVFELFAWGWAHALRTTGYEGDLCIYTEFPSLEKAAKRYDFEIRTPSRAPAFIKVPYWFHYLACILDRTEHEESKVLYLDADLHVCESVQPYLDVIEENDLGIFRERRLSELAFGKHQIAGLKRKDLGQKPGVCCATLGGTLKCLKQLATLTFDHAKEYQQYAEGKGRPGERNAGQGDGAIISVLLQLHPQLFKLGYFNKKVRYAHYWGEGQARQDGFEKMKKLAIEGRWEVEI